MKLYRFLDTGEKTGYSPVGSPVIQRSRIQLREIKFTLVMVCRITEMMCMAEYVTLSVRYEEACARSMTNNVRQLIWVRGLLH